MDEFKYKDKVCTPRWFKSSKSVYKYRCDPVPGIHKYKNGGWFRYPHTKQEMTNIYIPDEYDYQILNLQQINKLKKTRFVPTSWDDIMVKAAKNHNWKQFRKTKYRAIA